MEHLSYYYVYFQTLGKGMNLIIPLAMGKILALMFFNEDNFGPK